ncbi:MAG: porin family protein [Alphaproteobacteria bacterium]|nr:porin family protein [Alphaproteobacteria bacterium]
MKKLIFPLITLTVITALSAHAQNYNNYEQVEHNAPQYITVEGERYVRVPTQRPQQKYYQYQRPAQPQNTPQYVLTEQPTPVKMLLSAAPRFYIGADYSLNKTDISSYQGYEQILLNDENSALSGIIGLKFNPYVSLEAFYQKSDDADETSSYTYDISTLTIDTSLSYKAYGADLFFTIPLHQKIDLLFGLGYAQYDFDADITVKGYNRTTDSTNYLYGTDSHSTGAFRYNAGLQFEVYKDLYLRATARYVKFQKKSVLKDMKELSLGLRYVF